MTFMKWRFTPVVFFGLAGLLSPRAPCQDPPPALPPAFFAGRRALLMERIRRLTPEGATAVVVLRGAPARDDMARFTQDHDFWYLTGVAEPDVALLLLPGTSEEELLVPPFNRFTATWEGKRLAPGERAARETGFAKVGNVRGLPRRLDALLGPPQGADGGQDRGATKVVWTFTTPQPNVTATPATARAAARRRAADPFDGRLSREEAFVRRLKERYPGIGIRDVTPLLGEMRARKTPEEIACIRAASRIAAAGIAEAIRAARPGAYEFQLAAAARCVFSRLGAGPDAYGAIVGAGPNGCILHYNACSRRLEDGDLIVMDYAPTVNGYCSDVTRTFPANGRFTDEQRRLVEDVLAVQRAIIAEVRPGVRLSELSRLSRKLLAERGYRQWHGPSHHVGLAVHDKQGDVLEAGMVITVEPGAYLPDKGMGCRIEDTVLVTEDGCEVLSEDVPASPDAIERLARQPSVHAPVPPSGSKGR